MILGRSPLGSTPLGGGILLGGRSISLEAGDPAQQLTRIEVATFLERSLLERFRAHPEELRVMDRRQFEELVAELFDGFGYEVQLTCQTRDGGKDIVAVRRREVDTRILIQCKRPDPGNPVRVSTVRELLGVKADDSANKAILATTTHFTADAMALIERHKWELEGRDFDGLQQWIAQYFELKQ